MHDLAAAAFANAVHDLLVGKHALAAGAPVDRHFLFVCQSLFEHLQKNPLRPFIILRVGGVDLARPVEGKTERLQLCLEARHILFGHDGGMDMIFDGIVFRGETERIPTHGVEDIIALQTALARHDVQRRIGARMADMQPLSGRIGKLHQCIVGRLFMSVRRGKGVLLHPFFLPFFLDLTVIVTHSIPLGFHIVGDVDGFAVLPQMFKVIEKARILREDVDDQCAVVH